MKVGHKANLIKPKTYIIDLENYYNNTLNYNNITEEDAKNSVIYGIKCIQIEQHKEYKGIIFINVSNKHSIIFANQDKQKILKINLNNIQRITFDDNNKNINDYPIEKKKNKCIHILSDQKEYDFIFNSNLYLNTFIKGFYLILTNKNEIFSLEEDNMEDYFDELYRHYDRDFNKALDNKEFNNLATALGREKTELFSEIDKNHDNIIEYNEVVEYFRTFSSGKEFKDIFCKYSNLSQLITPNNLMLFFKNEEKEIIELYDAINIIIKFSTKLNNEEKNNLFSKIDSIYNSNNKTITEYQINQIINDFITKNEKINNKKNNFSLTMNLQEFSFMLYSEFMTVYDLDKIDSDLNEQLPLVDYYINSTHNTYLTGHQLIGTSSAHMYSIAVLQGFRLVELDCYNGNDDEVIVTHGYTFVSKINVKDILTELKKSAFINSPYPVILSIENHLDKKHQNILGNLFVEILEDLYIFPMDDIPKYLPNLSDLKYKFIIKCSGPLILKENMKEIPKRKKGISLENKIQKFEIIRGLSIALSDIEINKNEMKNISNEEMDNLKNKIKSVKNKLKKEIENENDDEEENEKNEDDENKMGEKLIKIRGLYGTKFKYDKIENPGYFPWEFVTVKSTKIKQYFNSFEKREKLIKFTSNSLMKIYPQSLDSSNYNIIECWSLGIQVSALNIQAIEDDFTLFDIVFFKQNKNLGYVTKPKKLLFDSLLIEKYEKPYFSLDVHIKIVFALSKIIQFNDMKLEKDKKMTISIYVLGTEYDIKNNVKYKFELIDGFIFTKIKDNEIMKFNIYEPDLAGLFFKIKYDKELFARACIPFTLLKEGYRKIPIYSNNCVEFKSSCMIGYFSKTKYSK